MPSAAAEAVATLRRAPERTAVLLDFDGTLAPIVDDPEDSRPVPGAADVLVDLAARYRVVAVVSGRPASFLLTHVGEGPTLVGLYGLERVIDGEVVRAPEAARWSAVIDEAAAAARAELPGEVGVEHKGLSLTLHVRRHPELAELVDRWAKEGSHRWGLQHGSARMSAELHPPLAFDKGTVATSLLAGGGIDTACFIGDDVGDLPAFAALERFAAEGGTARRIVVSSPETAPELAAAADLTVAGPAAVLELLRALL